jgi:hypothetical protein
MGLINNFSMMYNPLLVDRWEPNEWEWMQTTTTTTTTTLKLINPPTNWLANKPTNNNNIKWIRLYYSIYHYCYLASIEYPFHHCIALPYFILVLKGQDLSEVSKVSKVSQNVFTIIKTRTSKEETMG